MVIVICDDDNMIIDNHEEKLIEIAAKNRVPITFRVFNSGKELLELYNKSKFEMDLLFLEMHMPDMQGDEVISKLREIGYENEVVFLSVSTEKEHFKKAFKHRAFEYIIKGDSPDGELELIFLKAVEEYLERMREYIAISFAGETRNITIEDIYYFEYINHKIAVFYEEDQVFRFWDTLNNLENKLELHGFCKVKDFLLNMNKIHSISRDEVEMENGERITINKRRLAKFKSIYDTYIGIDSAN